MSVAKHTGPEADLYSYISASMLREHGAQRPTVFELLAHVHRLRGTKSKFSYTIPLAHPPLHRVSQTVTPSVPNNSPENPVSQGASIHKSGTDLQSTMPNQGIQARQKVLEAIAPMRRGRPTQSKEASVRQPSPQKSQPMAGGTSWLDSGFGTEENQAWKATKDKTKVPSKDDGWAIVTPQTPKTDISRSPGFGDDFAEKLWNTSNPNSASAKASPQPTASTTNNTTNETPVIPTPLAFTGSRMLRPKQDRIIPNKDKTKDAFDGLGLMTFPAQPAPTLGEARKIRTGLAVTSTSFSPQGDYLRSSTDKPATNQPRPSPSPRQTHLSPVSNRLPSVSPVSSYGNFGASVGRPSSRLANTPGPPPSGISDIDSRFPSLEELDAQHVSSANSLYSFVISDNNKKPTDVRLSHFKTKVNRIPSSDTGERNPKTNVFSNVTYNLGGIKFDQVAKDTPEGSRQEYHTSGSAKSTADRSSPSTAVNHQRRPSMIRKHRSSVSMKPNVLLIPTTDLTSVETNPTIPSQLSDRSPRDWLTGDDHENFSKSSRPVPVLRDSPSKRASFIAQSDLRIPESSSAQHVSVSDQRSDEPLSVDSSPTVSRFKRAFPDVEKIDVLERDSVASSNVADALNPERVEARADSSSSDEGPEEVGALHPTSHAIQEKIPALGMKKRQSSVHDLVNQYGGRPLWKEKENELERFSAQTSQNNDIVPRQSQSTGLAPPVKQEPRRKTPSPTTHLTPLVSPGIPSKPSYRPQPSISTQKPDAPLSTKPSSSRTRPQSMFIFPSNPTDHSDSIDTVNLMPPEDSRPRPRRLSISDMVQKYEAISSKGGSPMPPAPPSPIRPVSSKENAVNGRKTLSVGEKAITTFQASSPGDEKLGSNSTRPATSTSNTQTQLLNNGEPTSKRGKPLNRTGPNNRKPTLTTTESVSNPRRLSIKAAPTIITSSNRTDPLLAARAAKSTVPRDSSETSQMSRSPRKRTMSIPSNTPKTNDESPSPENEAYQGVSKLIDQWQKKSAEAEQSRPLPDKKRSFTTKRMGMAPTGG